WGGPKRSPMPFSGSVRTRQALSLAVQWSSTAAKRFSSCTERLRKDTRKESSNYGNQKSWLTTFHDGTVRLVHRDCANRPALSGSRSRVGSGRERDVWAGGSECMAQASARQDAPGVRWLRLATCRWWRQRSMLYC